MPHALTLVFSADRSLHLPPTGDPPCLSLSVLSRHSALSSLSASLPSASHFSVSESQYIKTPSPVSLLYRQCFVASPTLSGTVSSQKLKFSRRGCSPPQELRLWKTNSQILQRLPPKILSYHVDQKVSPRKLISLDRRRSSPSQEVRLTDSQILHSRVTMVVCCNRGCV
nr:hypothetical protein Iba_chr06bCG11750 [Ipomoea batatas]